MSIRETDHIRRRRRKLALWTHFASARGHSAAETLGEMEAKAKQMIDEAVQYAEQAPYPDADEAAGPVYAENVPEREISRA